MGATYSRSEKAPVTKTPKNSCYKIKINAKTKAEFCSKLAVEMKRIPFAKRLHFVGEMAQEDVFKHYKDWLSYQTGDKKEEGKKFLLRTIVDADGMKSNGGFVVRFGSDGTVTFSEEPQLPAYKA